MNSIKVSKSIFSTLALLIVSIVAFAQSVPEKVDVDINTGETAWYGQPWVWAIGVAVFIVIIIAITRGGNKQA